MRATSAVVLAVALLASACSSGPSAPDSSSYAAGVSQARADKDRFFQEDRESPIPSNKRDMLLPLPYYPVDPAYRVPAMLELAEDRPVFEMPTSTGELRKYQLVGSIEFTLQGEPMSLGAFVPAGEEISTLFVPFADMTTGQETYSAGRYLDLHPTATGLYTIDFNVAYNPYCAYNASYSCPYPPPSNRLKVPIRAGEMNPKG
jgi:uncharacterized protein (DUF1684 family)